VGVDYTAHTVLGVMIEAKEAEAIAKASGDKTVPGCNHHPLPKGAAFCPTCGAKAFVVEEVDFSLSDLSYELEGKGFDIGNTTDYTHIVVGLGFELDGEDSREPKRFPQIVKPEEQDLINRLKLELIPLGLYKPENYGYWSMISCSY